MNNNWLIRCFPWMSSVNRQSFRDDAIAGLTGASLAIPQGVAFAAIAGLPPQYGFYCALVAPIIAVLFGSSWHMVCGPTTAISALLFASLQGGFAPGSAEFIVAAISITLLAGVVQLVLGLVRLGNLSNFVSHAVMVGFITGAALLIILSQVKHALHIDLPRPEHLFQFLLALPSSIAEANTYSAIIALFTLVLALLIRRLLPKAPHYLIALIGGSVLCYLLNGKAHQVVLVGQLPSVVPPFALPELSLGFIRELAPGAVALALVGLLEAVAIARSIALKTGQKIDPNKEFIGQGLSNIVGSFFSSYMSSGSFTRSGINIDAGAKTPIAVILSSSFLFLILFFIAPLFEYLPVPAMASIIILVGWRLIALSELLHYAKNSKVELAIALVTLLGTLLIGLEFGLYAGIITSLALFLNKTAKPNVRLMAPLETEEGRYFHNVQRFDIKCCPQINFIRLDGPIYFGSAEYLLAELKRLQGIAQSANHWVILCHGISLIDIHGAHALSDFVRQFRRQGGEVYLVVRYVWQLENFERFGLLASIGKDNYYPGKSIAIQQLVPKRLDIKKCDSCSNRIFKECPQRD